MTRIFLGLGSNLGDRAQNLKQAIHKLDDHPQVKVRQLSAVYETDPWGLEEQPPFLNMAMALDSDAPPEAMLVIVKDVEKELGRRETVRWGPRIIDIDILFWGERVFESHDQPGLTIPHKSLAERAFVLQPLSDLAPEFTHAGNGLTVAQMLEDVDTSTVRRLPLPLEWGWRTYVMGIINMTPDSFSGDGLLGADAWLEAAVEQARQFVALGADILDVGGESTRPGSEPVTVQVELARVVPVIEALAEAVDVPISVDTYRASVAEAAIAVGASWINDVWGLQMDPEMAAFAASAQCPLILMHNRSQPKNVEQRTRLGGRYVGIHYDDLIEDIRRELGDSIDVAQRAGVREKHIIVDPGVGFGKTVPQNLRLVRELDGFKSMGYPLLLGTSRKSFIGYSLDLPPEERMEGTAATVAVGIDRGADIVRVHDVRAITRVARMTDRIVRPCWF